MKKILLITTLFLWTTSSFGQKAKQWVNLGDESWAKHDWFAAKIYYEKAFLLDSANFRNTVKYAEALRKTKDYHNAEYYYKKLYQKDKGKVFPEGLFWIATMQKYNGNYQEALRNFKKFNKKQRKNKNDYLFLKSKQEINSCKWAINARIDSGSVNVWNLNAPVNTPNSEFGAWLQDSVLYYSTISTVNSEIPSSGKIKILQANYDSIASQIEDWPFNSEVFHQANITFSKYGNTIYFSRCDSLSGCNIFKVNVNESQYNNVKKLKINSEGFNTTMPSLTTIDGKEVLFFASNREGGFGKMDIWWSVKENGEFQKPQNAGDKINSLDDEITPFYLNNKLFFSSNWHNGFGGFDIYESAGNPVGEMVKLFQEPKNLGYPINSSVNDLYYKYFPSVNQGFITSNRVGSMTDSESSTCCNDIWAVNYVDSIPTEIVDTLAYQTLAELNKYLPVTLYFHNDEPNPRTMDTTTTLSYMDAYKSYLNLEKKYIQENAKGFVGEQKEKAVFDVEDFFDFNVRKGKQDLEIFTQLLLKELQDGAAITLSVRGFASPLAESDYNVNLTKRRINSLINYLKKYQGGIFLPYFNASSTDGGILKIKEIPFGEFQANNSVSDALDNKKASIYSRGARMERKIEIMSVERIKKDSLYPKLDFPEEVFNFGIIPPNNIAKHSFVLQNIGNSILHIDSIEVSCGCTSSVLSRKNLIPNEKTTLEIEFNPIGQQGLITKEIYIYSNESTEPKMLVITAEIK